MGALLGMDLGSRAVKILELSEGGVTLRKSYDTSLFYRDYGSVRGGELCVSFDRLGLGDAVGGLTVTGYGRNTIRVGGACVVPEVKAHTVGAVHMTGLDEFTLLDIGGQDTKCIKVSGGRMEDFVMNDKCAASSGRYVENMAAVLGITMEDISRHWENPASLSAVCAVFGESELIQLRAEGVPVEELAAGVNLTIVKRVLPLLSRYPAGPVVFSGGVARNLAVARLIMRQTGRDVITLSEPAFNGALGCALISGGRL